MKDGSDANDSWRFDRSLSVGTILAILSVVVGIGGPILIWGKVIEARTQAIEIRQEALAKALADKQADDREQRKAFIERLDVFSNQVMELRLTLAGRK